MIDKIMITVVSIAMAGIIGFNAWKPDVERVESNVVQVQQHMTGLEEQIVKGERRQIQQQIYELERVDEEELTPRDQKRQKELVEELDEIEQELDRLKK